MCAHKDGYVPHGTIKPQDSWLRIAGHLAVWAVAYAVGVAVVLGAFLDRPIGGLGLVYVMLCGHGGYVLDRVKFRDVDLDPADLMAEPGRHGYLRRRAGWLRILMVVEWVGAAAVGAVISPVLGGVVLGGVLAGYLYSGWRPGKVSRLKDVAGLKAGLVSCAVVGLGLFAVLGESIGAGFGWVGGLDWVAVGGVVLVVCGDAVVCDLDDRESDGAYLTRSVPVSIGSRGAKIVAAVLLVLGSVVLAAWSPADQVRMRALFGGLIAVSGIGIMRRPTSYGLGGRRDWIDGRMLVVALVVVLVG